MDAGEGATASYMKGPAMARILCVDNYDSFVFTIVGYLRHLGAIVDVVRNDVERQDLKQAKGESQWAIQATLKYEF